MAIYVQYRHGTTAEHASFTGGAQEVTVDTTKKTLVVHDGSTAGGFPVLREDLDNAKAWVATSKNVVPSTANSTFAPLERQVLNGDGTWRVQNFTGYIKTVSSTSYTLVAEDAETYIRLTSTSTSKTIEVPTNSSVAFPVGTTISGISTAGQLTIIAASGVTINSPETLKLRNKNFTSFSLIKVGTNEWDLAGDLEAA